MIASLICAVGFAWPAPTRESRPWVYNWWMGSAVTEAGLQIQIQSMKDAGFGGFHVIPIYGVKGNETNDVKFLSEKWMDKFAFAVRLAEKMDMGVDLSGAPGFTFGGPEIDSCNGYWNLVVEPCDANGKAGDTNLWHGVDGNGKAVRLVARRSGRRLKKASEKDAGLMVDPFSAQSMSLHLEALSAAFDREGAALPRAMYHDSYDYHGAGWTPGLSSVFERARGYRLEPHFAALAGIGSEDEAGRVREDYRQTVSEMMVDAFSRWTEWCRSRKIMSRYEAHGAPADWLALYALSDSPETEICGHWRGKALVAKFASSAAHIANRRLVSSETGTWLADHYHVRLRDMKCLCDALFLSGVNHVFYHGMNYSPPEAEWPGWVFYASTQVNPQNPIWHDLPALNAYVTRCQSILQKARPDNGILVYWPLHDFWRKSEGLVSAVEMSVGNFRKWFDSEPVGKISEFLLGHGLGFDFVSDGVLEMALSSHAYKAVVVPRCSIMPLETASRFARFGKAGGRVLFEDALPDDVPGLKDVSPRRESLKSVFAEASFSPLSREGIYDVLRPESVDWASRSGLSCLRLTYDSRRLYFVVNQGRRFAGRIAFPSKLDAVSLLDPWSGDVVPARLDAESVYLELEQGQSMFVLDIEPAVKVPDHPVKRSAFAIGGPWKLSPVCGGPISEKERWIDKLESWSKDGNPFCGTMRYATQFSLPADLHVDDGFFVLDAGTVHESALARINGNELGIRIMPPFRWRVPVSELKPTGNTIEFDVTNLGANRIRDMDVKGVEWKVFKDSNVLSPRYKPLDASKWSVLPSGLLGPVKVEIWRY